MESVFLGPLANFGGVADCRARLMAEVDTAFEIGGLAGPELCKFCARDVRIDAGDEQPAAGAVAEERHRGRNPFAANAGINDDAVSMRRGFLRFGQAGDESNKPARPEERY